jgi:hypothetical protein
MPARLNTRPVASGYLGGIRTRQTTRHCQAATSGCLPAGAVAGWALHPLEKRRLITAHTLSRRSVFLEVGDRRVKVIVFRRVAQTPRSTRKESSVGSPRSRAFSALTVRQACLRALRRPRPRLTSFCTHCTLAYQEQRRLAKPLAREGAESLKQRNASESACRARSLAQCMRGIAAKPRRGTTPDRARFNATTVGGG